MDALALTAMLALCTRRLLMVEMGHWHEALTSSLDWEWNEEKIQLLQVTHQHTNAVSKN